MTGVFSFDEIRKTTTGALDRAKLVFHKNGEEQEEGEEEESQQPDRLEELSAFCPQLTWQQRLIGFVSCFSIGCTYNDLMEVTYSSQQSAMRTDMIAFFSFKFFIKLVEGHPVPFAVNYTFGHILQLMVGPPCFARPRDISPMQLFSYKSQASTFLCGPQRQFRCVSPCHTRLPVSHVCTYVFVYCVVDC